MLQEVHARLPHCRYSYALDNEWFPYGEKSDAQLLQRILAYFEVLLAQARPDLVVIACNTASTLALDSLRQRFPVPFVGVVPAIKPAVQLSRSRIIGLLATPATVKRSYVERLQADHGQGCGLIKISCPLLVQLAEAKMRGEAVCESSLEQAVADIQAHPGVEQVDVFVLGCTHFPALRDELARYWPATVQWLDSGAAIARRVESLLSGEVILPQESVAGSGLPRVYHSAVLDAQREEALRAIFGRFGVSELHAVQVPSLAADPELR